MKTTNIIFKVLHVVAWLIFVGLSIEACGLLVNFICSIYKPEFVPNLYQKLNLTEMYSQNKWDFYKIYSLTLSISFLKAFLFYIVVMLMYRLDLSKPFNQYVSDTILKISYFTFSIGILGYITKETIQHIKLEKFILDNLSTFSTDSEAFILMSAIIYIIAIIFKKGIEIQNENELTI
jgi:hypothetical protein